LIVLKAGLFYPLFIALPRSLQLVLDYVYTTFSWHVVEFSKPPKSSSLLSLCVGEKFYLLLGGILSRSLPANVILRVYVLTESAHGNEVASLKILVVVGAC
jgi:hypothetical protein